MEVEIAIVQARTNLRSIERGPEAVGLPRTPTLIGQDGGQELRDLFEHLAQVVI